MDYDSIAGSATVTYPGGAQKVFAGPTPPLLTMFPAFSFYGTPTGSFTVNFGASPFAYPVPSGYQAGLCQ